MRHYGWLGPFFPRAGPSHQPLHLPLTFHLLSTLSFFWGGRGLFFFWSVVCLKQGLEWPKLAYDSLHKYKAVLELLILLLPSPSSPLNSPGWCNYRIKIALLMIEAFFFCNWLWCIEMGSYYLPLTGLKFTLSLARSQTRSLPKQIPQTHVGITGEHTLGYFTLSS